MSVIQTIIGAAVGSSGPSWYYPPPGNMYPQTGPSNDISNFFISPGYYEESSLLNTPQLGLYRRTYDGTALASDFTISGVFPSGFTEVRTDIDPYVGFGPDFDIATNFTMQWLGYFKPAVSGDFCFGLAVDDYALMWIGDNAVNNVQYGTAVASVNNGDSVPMLVTLTANKYYPVRIIYTEVTGAHNCSVWSGLNQTTLRHNQDSADTGQFFFDTNAATGVFPGTGLIV